MNKLSFTCLALAVLVALPGCRTPAEKAQARAEKHQKKDAELKASIPADSPLAKLEAGMSVEEVVSILGAPNSQDGRPTGKQFIPFNYGQKDSVRTVYNYKGIGHVEFSSGSWGQQNGIVTMVADPSATGFPRRK